MEEKFKDIIKAVMLGHAIGDALGVPVEFLSREELRQNPVVDMQGYGTYPMPAGSWSDDTSMSLCTLESLTKGLVDYDDIMINFGRWYRGSYHKHCLTRCKLSVRRIREQQQDIKLKMITY